MLERLEESYDDIGTSASYVRRLLALPFATRQDRHALLQYLSGREPEEGQLKRLGLTRGLSDEDVMPALRALAIVASFGAPIVILFDQLENLVGDDGERIHAHARIFAELFDPPMRGLVLVQMALDREWAERIRPRLGEAERSRLESQTLSLALPTPEQRDSLLHRWGERLDPEIEAGPGDLLPRHVVIIDEFQDLLVDKTTRAPFEAGVQRMGSKARGAGIHLVLATQRPDAKTVSGIIKANLPGRIALRVQQKVNSQIILGQAGAEELMGQGDLLADLGHGLVRAQAAMLG